MRAAILITARLGSTRLARKHLLPVGGKPILQYLIDAINREFSDEIARDEVIVAIATSERPENGEFSKAISGCAVFAGSDENIPLRHSQAADSFNADTIISVDGDDILCSPRAMRAVYSALCAGANLVKTTGLPLGMNATGYSSSVLRLAIDRFGRNNTLETGWGRVFAGIDPVEIKLRCEAPDNLRFTLDYEEDYRFFSALLEEPAVVDGSADDVAIVRNVLARGLDKITQPLVDEYWKNFYANIDREKERSKE
jgi:spore coat polysaccharide biosynthesis protein SpsF